MPIDNIIDQLREERNRIDRAIQVLGGIRSGPISRKAATKASSPALRQQPSKSGGRRKLSTAARRKIAAAQRARWAKIKAAKK